MAKDFISTNLIKKTEKKKTTITDFVYHIRSSKQATNYETTTDFVINYIKKHLMEEEILLRHLR